MNTLIRKIGRFALLSGTVLLMSCGGGTSDDSVPGGSWYATGFEWPHDGTPRESENFVIYSDGAGEEAKEALAVLAEVALAELEYLLAVDSGDLLYPPGQEKIDIYAYRNRFPQQWGGWGFYGGLLIFSPDHPERSQIGHTDPEIFIPTLRHELTHVLESLLKGGNDPNLVDVWLTEGLAEALSGGTARGRITTWEEFNDLRNRYGTLNPIAMHRYEYPDIESIAYDYYYPMFQLAVEYLVDPDGHGGTLQNVRDLLLDVRDGVPFAISFQTRFGMSLAEFESRFFDLMDDYLP